MFFFFVCIMGCKLVAENKIFIIVGCSFIYLVKTTQMTVLKICVSSLDLTELTTELNPLELLNLSPATSYRITWYVSNYINYEMTCNLRTVHL